MSERIRTVKPESLRDEELWDLESETGLPIFRAFVGLWCQADKRGRFEWRARPLGALILPYWHEDFNRVLDALESRGFLVKYECDGRWYGWIPTFEKHQHVNPRESESKLPPPPKDATGKRRSRERDARRTGESREADAPIPSLPLPVPDPFPIPEGAAGEPSEEALLNPPDSDRETVIPLDFERRVVELGVDRILAQRLKVPLESVQARTQNFVGYWGSGAGMGKTKPNWMRAYREDVRQAKERNQLKPPGAIQHSARSGYRGADDAPNVAPSPALALMPGGGR